MSFQNRQVENLHKLVRRLQQRENNAKSQLARKSLRVARWAVMLYHEYVRDDVRVRAESLSYLMLFSFLPLVAGGFFIFNIFAQFGMVQEALGGFLNRFLETIPEEHREFVTDYVLKFKDAYLASLGTKSGTLGIFALFFLAWVGLKVYVNVDRTLNVIWSSERNRPWLEQARNFLVVSIVAPIVLTAALSIPLILRRGALTHEVLDSIPLLSALLNWGLPLLIVVGVFAFLYRFVPVDGVRWRNALIGGLFTGATLQVANLGMNLYFRFGTQTAYGKAAVLPLIGFWIYLAWVIVILGAEVSFLLQHGRRLFNTLDPSPTLVEAEGLVCALVYLLEAFRGGQNPVSVETLRDATGLDSTKLAALIEHLQKENLVLETRARSASVDTELLLSRDLAPVKVSSILSNFLGNARLGSPAQRELWNRGLKAWAASYGDLTFGELARSPAGAPQ